MNNTYYHEEKKSGFSGSISSKGVSIGYGKSQSIYAEKGKTNAKSTLHLGDGTALNKGAEITATDFTHGQIIVNNGDVKFGARIDTRDVHTESKSSSFGISAGINSPILDRAKQAGNVVKQVKDGDTAGGMIEVVNVITGTVQGMSGNITKINDSRATMKNIENGDFKVNNSFYVGGNLRVSFNKSKSSSDSHTESAVVTTMKPSNDNATITYNNVNNVTYQGTQDQGGIFIYNNVANIQKEAVELKNRYSSKNSSLGMGLSAGIGSKGSIKSNGISGNVSQSNGNFNTEGTNYQNGNFVNVNEVHNNTGSMTLTGFNQEGGKVTGNIEKLVVESKQNTSITTGSSRNVGVGFSGNGIPNSLNVSQNNTNGNKNYVENQSSFTVGQGSNLQVGTLENTASIIEKQSENATFKVNNYIGKNFENEDTMTITGGSVGASLGQNLKITSVGFNQDSKEKEGIIRNTVLGNVEIGQVSGDEINRDLSKANEITKDVHKTTNINIEPQLIEYTSNPTKFKEDLEVAVLEGKATGETVLKSIENVVNGGKEEIGDPERRSLNEIKETVIRVKTAPEMNLIATGDLNSQEVLNSLDINAIEKFNPDDPDLPKNVRTRLDEVRRNGGEIEAFYDKTTNKIFINENVEDSETRALVAREWKISEDLKDGKGKANDEGQLKATVAGELAYDDMMKRAGEGKTRSISIDELKIGSMDIDSEITADFNNKHVDKFLGRVGSILNKVKKGDFKGAYKEAEQTKQDVTRVLKNDIKTVSKGGPVAKETIKESANATVYAVKKIVPKSKKKSTKKSPLKGKAQPKNNITNDIGKGLEKAGTIAKDVVVNTGLVALGGVSAGVEDLSLGVVYPRNTDGSRFEPNNKFYYVGQVVGHVLTTVIGTGGTIGGTGAEIVAIGASPETAGVSIVATIPAEAVKTYSASVTTKGAFGISESLIKLSNPKNSSNTSSSTDNKNSNTDNNPKNNSKQNHNSKITNNTNSTAFTSNGNISASKIRNNGVKLDVPKDLKSKITDIAKKGDLQGFKTEEVVNEILKRDTNVELLDSGKYGSNNGFDHVFRNKKTGEVWILDSKQIAKSGNMKVSNKGVGKTRQMSLDWVREVNKKLKTNSPVRKAIREAINSDKLNTGLVGVDKKTGELIFIPTRITNIKK